MVISRIPDKPAAGGGTRAQVENVITDNLISLETPPRPAPKPKTDFLADLTEVLSSPPLITSTNIGFLPANSNDQNVRKSAAETQLNSAELQNLFPTTQQLQMFGKMSLELETADQVSAEQPEIIYQTPGGEGGDNEWNDEDYQEPER
jgi:hypothetical protein